MAQDSELVGKTLSTYSQDVSHETRRYKSSQKKMIKFIISQNAISLITFLTYIQIRDYISANIYKYHKHLICVI